MKTERGLKGLLFAILLVQVVMILLFLVLRPGEEQAGERKGPAGSSLGADLKATAMELEERSLDGQAAAAWEKYLESAPAVEERPQILYRIGKLSMQAGRYEEAAAAFIRADLASKGDGSIKAKTGPKLVECLRKVGLYGEVGRELSRRVELGGEDRDRGEVLATFAGEELKEADLDRMIERRVDQMLALQAGDAREEQRKAMLDQFKDPSVRKQLFQELLQTELFSRRARELKLDQAEDFLDSKELLEQSLLANRFMSQTLEKIQLTEVDIEAYYKAFQKDYEEPERLEAVLITLEADEDGETLLASMKSGSDFKALAAERSAGEGKSDPSTWEVIKGRYHAKLGADTDPLFALEEGEWTRSVLQSGDARYLVLVEKKFPSRIPPLAEVRDRAVQDYVGKKQQELGEEVFRDLMVRYDVKILSEPGAPRAPVAEEEGDKDTDHQSVEKASSEEHEEGRSQ